MNKFNSMYLLIFMALFGCKKNKHGDPFVPVVPQEEPAVPGVPISAHYDGYDLTWQDEFNNSTLDPQKWIYETGTGVNGDFGTGQLDRATSRSINVSVNTGVNDADGGALAITTTKESFMDRNYTSGRINTSGKFTCGPGYRVEARVWARDVRYKGQGFAFWMMPAEIPANENHLMWPQGGEVDIMEYVGAIPNFNLGTVHYAWSWENNEYKDWNHGHKGAYYSYAEQQVPITNPSYGNWPITISDKNSGSGAFHIYRVDWFNDRIEFSVDEHIYHINYFNDGAVLNQSPDGQDQDASRMVNGKRLLATEYTHHFNEWHPFEHQFYLILSAGVGGNENSSYGGSIVPEAVFPCSTFVDWVRVYKRK